MNPEIFEKLGVFYLGRPLDPTTSEPIPQPLLYDSRDLTTHAVCIGMTGSGKTGLCLALLEEAALDGVPAIVIDPKGDLANLALTFPDLRAEDFLPWIHPEEAARKNMEPAAYAEAQARLWREGLAKWGQGPDRIRRLRERAEIVIFTPGSSAGMPVNVLSSFDPPATNDPEAQAEKAQTAAAGLLGLLKIPSDPLQSREGIFLTALLAAAWRAGRSVSLETLIASVQHPPFDKIGVLDIESYFPAKDRFALVMALNNLLAAPQFEAWRQGPPLDVARALRGDGGRARISIFPIAHLGDEERMFFVTLLLNEVLSWMRAQSGTTSLRAILYMDEIFGFLPPAANPPSKTPFLTLLKQARAFGLGIVVATQNPVDLDYKALSNAGTWFLGRLQTERDKARVLDGLAGASGAGAFDRSEMDRLLSSLGNRKFLLHNVHADGPILFETRWAMSYMCGPLTRGQIRKLTPQQDPASPAQPTAQPAAAPVPAETPPLTKTRPVLPPEIPQLRLHGNSNSRVFHPCLLARATVAIRDAKLGVDLRLPVSLTAGIPDSDSEAPDWRAGPDNETRTLAAEFPEEAAFAAVPPPATRPKNYPAWEKNFRSWLLDEFEWRALACRELSLVSRPGESEAGFRARAAQAARETRDEQLQKLRARFEPRRAALENRLARAEASLHRQQEEARNAQLQSMLTIGTSVLGALLSRKKLTAGNITRAGSAMRGVSRAAKQSADVRPAQETARAVRAQIQALDEEFAAAAAALASAQPAIETIALKPSRTGISDLSVSLAWQPLPVAA